MKYIHSEEKFVEIVVTMVRGRNSFMYVKETKWVGEKQKN